MKVQDYSQMIRHMTRDKTTDVPGSMAHKARIMDQAALVDDLEPGALKDEMLKNFDPSQETYEEYLQRINLERPFNMNQGGRIGFKRGKNLDLTAQGIQRWKTLDEKITPSQLKKTAKKLQDLGVSRNIARGIRITPDGNFRFTSESAGGVDKSFSDKATTLEDAIKWRDEWFKSKGLDPKGLRIKKTGKFKTVPGQPHIKFNGVTYQVALQRGDEGAQYFSSLKDAIKERDTLVKKYPPKSFTDYNIKEKPKQVNADILELYKDPTIKNIFKTGELTDEAITKASNILGVNKGTAIDRLEQLSSALMGVRKNVPGIKPAFTENAKSIVLQLPVSAKRTAELATGIPLEGESIKVKKDQILRGEKYPTDIFDIDEARATATGLKRGTSPYSIFGQIIDRNVNRVAKGGFEGGGWDAKAGTLEKSLDNAIQKFGANSKEAKAAMTKYNKEATKFENEVNSKKLRGAKRVRIPRISLDAPSKTIANWANFNKKYKDVFNENFKTKKYGFVIPKDLKTIPELRKEVLNPKSSTYKTMINHLKEGFNEYDEKKLFQKIKRMTDEAPDAVKKIMRLIPRIAQVDDFETNRFASANNIMSDATYVDDVEEENFIKRNPVTTAAAGTTAGTMAGVISKFTKKDPLKQLRRIPKKILGKLFTGASAPFSAGAFSLSNILDIDKDSPIGVKIQDDPNIKTAGAELLLPELSKKALSKLGGPKGLQTLLSLGKYGRALTPVGIATMGVGVGKDYYDFAKDEIARVKAMPEDERRAYNEALMDEGSMFEYE